MPEANTIEALRLEMRKRGWPPPVSRLAGSLIWPIGFDGSYIEARLEAGEILICEGKIACGALGTLRAADELDRIRAARASAEPVQPREPDPSLSCAEAGTSLQALTAPDGDAEYGSWQINPGKYALGFSEPPNALVSAIRRLDRPWTPVV